MVVVDMFCDASIDKESKIACGGNFTLINEGNNRTPIGYDGVIQFNATNNSSEILAIHSAIVRALDFQKVYGPKTLFRIFSDSKISIYGLRDWIQRWITNIDKNGVLMSSSNQPVANQQRYIQIYNMIVMNNLNVRFYHQRGHVIDGKVSLTEARVSFIRANKITPERLGYDIKTLSEYNNMIDNLTRDTVKEYLKFAPNFVLPSGVHYEYIDPVLYYIRSDLIYQYNRCIGMRR